MGGPEDHRLLHVPAEFWRRLERLRERITKRLPPGADPPSLQALARNAMDLGIHTLGRRLSKEERGAGAAPTEGAED